MKSIINITEEEVKEICNLLGQSYIDYMTNDDGKWDGLNLLVQITTESTVNGSDYDKFIWIYKNGDVSIFENNGEWNGSQTTKLDNTLVLDYIKKRGYELS